MGVWKYPNFRTSTFRFLEKNYKDKKKHATLDVVCRIWTLPYWYYNQISYDRFLESHYIWAPIKLSYLLYTVLNNTSNFESKWLTHIKKLLNDTGRFDFWLTQSNIHCYSLGIIVKGILIDQKLQNWHSCLQHSSRGTNYQLFKNDVNLEPYFLLLQQKHFIPLVKFRTGNHYFPFETKKMGGNTLKSTSMHFV